VSFSEIDISFAGLSHEKITVIYKLLLVSYMSSKLAHFSSLFFQLSKLCNTKMSNEAVLYRKKKPKIMYWAAAGTTMKEILQDWAVASMQPARILLL
jgi:hypothetical protein